MRPFLGLRRLLPWLLLALSSCTPYIPFTNRIRNDYILDDGGLKRIQYYVSDEFYLRRDSAAESSHVTPGGTLKFVDGRMVEEVRIKKHTPCVAIGAELRESRVVLQMSFVPRDNANYIEFGVDPENINRSDTPFTLIARDWQGAVGHVRYDGKDWTIHDEHHARLLIRRQSAFMNSKKVQTLPGRMVE